MPRKRAGGSGISTLALDFDGTLRLRDAPVEGALLQQLISLKHDGIRIILVTGRCLSDLREQIDIRLFDATILENGAIALIGSRKINLAPPGWASERERLLRQFKPGCEEVIISLPREMEREVTDRIPAAARVEFNKDSLMILPSTTSKGSALLAVQREMGFRGEGLMCIGDAENDLSMFRVSHRRIAVGNSVEILKREADYVTKEGNGRGVAEAIKKFILRDAKKSRQTPL